MMPVEGGVHGASRTRKEGSHVGKPFPCDAVQEMEDDGPSGVALRREASNRPLLRWLKTVVVSEWGKGADHASGRDREVVPEVRPGGGGCVVEASRTLK